MMFRTEDFHCDEHGTFEEIITERLDWHPCPECGAASKRILSVGMVNPKFVYFKSDTARTARR